MTKKQLLDLLEPFMDETDISVDSCEFRAWYITSGEFAASVDLVTECSYPQVDDAVELKVRIG